MAPRKFFLTCCLLGSLPFHTAQAVEEITAPDAPAAEAASPNQAGSITFMDSKLFDGKLAKELESGRNSVEIAISGRIPLNNIPSRIDRWLVVSAEEGTVETLPSPARSRTLLAFVPMMFNAMGFLKGVREDKLYEVAKPYDTKIYYRNENGESLIERIVLTKRKPR